MTMTPERLREIDSMNAWTWVLIIVLVVLVSLPDEYNPFIYIREWLERKLKP